MQTLDPFTVKALIAAIIAQAGAITYLFRRLMQLMNRIARLERKTGILTGVAACPVEECPWRSFAKEQHEHKK